MIVVLQRRSELLWADRFHGTAGGFPCRPGLISGVPLIPTYAVVFRFGLTAIVTVEEAFLGWDVILDRRVASGLICIRIDLRAGTANMLVDNDELARRAEDLEAAGGFAYPPSQTPWQEIQRGIVGQFDEGMVLEPAVKYQDIARTKGLPRNNH